MFLREGLKRRVYLWCCREGLLLFNANWWWKVYLLRTSSTSETWDCSSGVSSDWYLHLPVINKIWLQSCLYLFLLFSCTIGKDMPSHQLKIRPRSKVTFSQEL